MLEAPEDLVRRHWRHSVPLFQLFFCFPGRFRPWPVGGFARGPRSSRVDRAVQVYVDARKVRVVTLDLPRIIACLPEYGWGCSSIAPFCRVRVGISTEIAAVGAALSVVYEYHVDEKDKRIPACIADIVGDTVGVVAGVGVVLFGSFAQDTCAALVLTAFSDALDNSWIARRHPALFSLELR